MNVLQQTSQNVTQTEVTQTDVTQTDVIESPEFKKYMDILLQTEKDQQILEKIPPDELKYKYIYGLALSLYYEQTFLRMHEDLNRLEQEKKKFAAEQQRFTMMNMQLNHQLREKDRELERLRKICGFD